MYKKKAKSGIKVTSERWDPISQSWVVDDGSYKPVTSSSINQDNFNRFEGMNTYAGSFNQSQLPTYYTPYNEVRYDGIITPNYVTTTFNPITNKWENPVQKDVIELSPEYIGDWSNSQRKSFESSQPSQIGPYKTTKGKRRLFNYSNEYDEFKYGGKIKKANDGLSSDFWGNQSYYNMRTNAPGNVSIPQPLPNNYQEYNQASQTPSMGATSGIQNTLGQITNFVDDVNQVANDFTKGAIIGGNALALSLLGKEQDERQFRPYQPVNNNPFAYGTGSQAIAKDGIHIDPKNKGKFNATKKRTGKTTEELTHSKNPLTRKRAIFAQNAAKWNKKEDGGTIDNLNIYEGGDAELLSYNPYSPETIQFNGQSHDNGGIQIDYNNIPVEVEGGETMTGNVVFGNMKVPGTKTKFKNASKQIAKEENKASKQMNKGTILLDNSPTDAYNVLKINTGKVLQEGADIKLQNLAQTKNDLAFVQDIMLKSKENNKMMKDGGKIAKDGLTLAERNNNPGNLRFIGQKGASKGDKGFAKFNSYEEGFQAMVNDLKAKQTGKTSTGLNSNSSLQDLINVYAPAADNNNPTSYANTVSKLLNVPINSRIGDINTNDLAKAMASVEDIAYSRKMNPQSSMGRKTGSIQDRSINTRPLNQINPLPILSFDPNDNNQTNNDFSSWYTNNWQPNVYNQQPIEEPFKGPYDSNTPIVNSNMSNRPPINSRSFADTNKLRFSDVAPEVASILSNLSPEFVQGQEYNPTLYTPYQVSFQDRINENNSQVRAIERIIPNNPAALSQIAANAYRANNQVQAEEFRTNQAITNDVINKNVSLMNDAQLRNIQLRDQQYARQSQANSNTRTQLFDALNSLSNKFSKNKRENTSIRLYENLFPNYRANQQGEISLSGPDATFVNQMSTTTTPSGYIPTSRTVTEDSKGNKRVRTREENLFNKLLSRKFK